MAYIEPLRLVVRSENENPSPVTDDKKCHVPDWPENHDYAFNKVIDEKYDIVQKKDIMDSFKTAMSDLFENIHNVDEQLGERAQRGVERMLERPPSERLMILTKPDIVLFTSASPGLMFMISHDSDPVDEEINNFKTKIDSFANIAGDFGLEVELLNSREFAHSMSEKLESDVERRDEFDNSFEEQIHSEISESVTRSLDANVTLKFGDNDPEVFEYDLLIHATNNKRIVVEAKDGSHEDADLGKSKLIDTPRDKTNIIGSKDTAPNSPFREVDQTKSFVVVKDMNSTKLKQHRQKAERRDVNLLDYDEGEYISKIEEAFKSMVYSEMI